MSFADSNRTGLRYIRETSFGVKPTSGDTKQLRFTSSALAAAKETVVSDEIRADRMVSSVAEVGATSGGDIGFEFAAGTVDDFLEAFLAGDWTTDVNHAETYVGSTVEWTANDTLTVQGETPGYEAGDYIKVQGFLNPANNGYFEVDSISGANITVTTTTSVSEQGRATSRVADANDVVVLNSTTISTVAADDQFASSGTEFSALISTGQLQTGQRIFVEGFGRETGSITFDATATVGDVYTLDDGTHSFEVVAGTHFEVGASANDSATNFVNAVNRLRAEGKFAINAADGTGVANLTNMRAGGSISVTNSADTTLSAFSGGQTGVRGTFTIADLASDGSSITVVEDIPADVSAGDPITIKASMLRNPDNEAEITPASFAVQQSHFDVSQFFTYLGQRVGALSLEVSTGAIVSGSVTLGGTKASRSATDAMGNSPYTPKSTAPTEVVNATTNVGSLVKNGAELATALQSISMEGQANLRNQNAVSTKFPRGIGLGRLNITGSFTAYFENGEMWDHFFNHDTVSLAWNFQDLDGNVYWFTLPAIKITSDPISPGGIDQDVLEELEFTTFRDGATKTQMQIDRFSSTTAV
jgi:hypothetical protein